MYCLTEVVCVCVCDKINSHVYLHSMAHERAFQLRCELLLSVNIVDAFSGECKKGQTM